MNPFEDIEDDLPESLKRAIKSGRFPHLLDSAVAELSPQQQQVFLQSFSLSSEEERLQFLLSHPDVMRSIANSLHKALNHPPEFQESLTRFNEAYEEYYKIGNTDLIEECIDLLESVIEHEKFQALEQEAKLPTLANYGTVLVTRYEYAGNRADLEKALLIFKEVVSSTPNVSIRLPGRLNNLGMLFDRRYELLGNPDDLQNAVDTIERCIASTPETNPFLPNYLGNLGNVFRAMYKRTGKLIYLDKSFNAYSRSEFLTPANHPERPGCLHNLGTSWSDRAERFGSFEDLGKAAECFEQAVRLSQPNSPANHLYFGSLAGVLLSHFEHTKNIESLNTAIDVYRSVIQQTPATSPMLDLHLANLAGALIRRFDHIRLEEDVMEALELTGRALTQLPDDSPKVFRIWHARGRCFAARYTLSKDASDRAKATEYFSRVCSKGTENVNSPEEVLRCSKYWGDWSLRLGRWVEAARAFAYAEDMMDFVVRSQIFRRGKELWLMQTQGVSIKRAFALAKLEEGQAAVVALERGRARILNETLRLNQATLESLRDSEHETFVDEFAVSLREWNLASKRVHAKPPDDVADIEAFENDLVADLEAAQKNLSDATERIRQISGYDRFLLPAAFEDISTVSHKPLVYIGSESEESFALVVINSDVEIIWSSLTDGQLKDSFMKVQHLSHEDSPSIISVSGYLTGQLGTTKHLSGALDHLLPLTGSLLMEPVANRLRALKSVDVVLIPTGKLASLPLHAAVYSKEGENVALIDEFNVAYAPTALTLANVSKKRRSEVSAIFVGVGNPMPVEPSLEFAKAEVQEIARLFSSANAYTCYEENATKNAFLDLIQSGDYLHLACHGQFAINEPLSSSLIFSEGEQVTLEDILLGDVNLSHFRLVVLSACQSGIHDLQGLADEYIGFPTAIMQAGADGVLATLWSIADFSSAMMMIKFYELLLTQDRRYDPCTALSEAQRWLKRLTLEEVMMFVNSHSAFAPQLRERVRSELLARMAHFRGTDDSSENLPFSDPIFWAPFIYVGS